MVHSFFHKQLLVDSGRKMAVILKPRVKYILRKLSVENRIISMTFFPDVQDNSSRFQVVGHHAPHGSEQDDHFTLLSSILGRNPRHMHVMVVGDTNVDWSMNCPDDPFARHIYIYIYRNRHHTVERRRLKSLVDAHKCKILILKPSAIGPGGIWSQCCQQFPFSRIPAEAHHSQKPSLLDYAFVNMGAEAHASLQWKYAPGDHAILCVEMDITHPIRKPPQKVWRPKDDFMNVYDWFSENPVDGTCTHESMVEFLRHAQNQNSDPQSRKQKKQQRLPTQIRDLFAKARRAPCEGDRKKIKQFARKCLQDHIKRNLGHELEQKIKQGKGVKKNVKLHDIAAITINEECDTTNDRREMIKLVQHHFQTKWDAGRMASLDLLKCKHNVMADTKAQWIQEQSWDFWNNGVFGRLGKAKVCDQYNLCIEIFRFWCWGKF